ncbi:MAG: hypothetical protein IT462_00485 [Planctomycetes bacterium]|nr:hypothetical protein [Planctomycetota bacterium]
MCLAACSGGNAPATNAIPSLDAPKDAPAKPDGPAAPTDAHDQMQRLFPKSALVPGSITHGGWDGAGSNFYSDAEKGEGATRNAVMPAVRARYNSVGFKIENVPESAKDKPSISAQQNLPQTCDLYIVTAPDEQAALTLERNVHEKLKAAEFGDLTDLLGPKPKGEIERSIKRKLRVQPGDKQESAHVAYTLVIGNLFCYALETENRSTVMGPDGKPDPQFTVNQRGSSLGGQLLLLVDFAATHK